jgi:phage tail-like protein
MPVNILTSLSSIATDPIRNFKFQVNITAPSGTPTNNLVSLGFTSCSGLAVTTESIPYRQGGYNTTVQNIPGQTQFTPVTLSRGVVLGTPQAWNWMRAMFSVIAGGGSLASSGDFRTNVDILVLDHPTTTDRDGITQGQTTAVKLRFRLYRAWINSLTYSELNAGDNALMVEQMVLVHEGFDMKWASKDPGSEAPVF